MLFSRLGVTLTTHTETPRHKEFGSHPLCDFAALCEPFLHPDGLVESLLRVPCLVLPSIHFHAASVYLAHGVAVVSGFGSHGYGAIL